MSEWKTLFSSAENSGVYAPGEAPVSEIRRSAADSRLAFFHVDLAGVTGKPGFMSAAASAFAFPDYFGENWDAFEDCLTDLDWCESAGAVLLIDGAADFTKNCPAEMETARCIFKDVAAYWRDRDARFFVVLAG
jgi:hypothetical protein